MPPELRRRPPSPRSAADDDRTNQTTNKQEPGGTDMIHLTRRTALAALVSGLAAGSAIAQEAPKQEVTIDFFGLASHNWQPVIDKFQQEYPTIKVKFTKFSTDEMKQALRVGASSGKMPDTWWNWGGSLASPYNQAGLVLEI